MSMAGMTVAAALVWVALGGLGSTASAQAPPAAAAPAPDLILGLSAQETPSLRIGWFRNQTLEAYRRALDTGKPLVLIVGEPAGQWFTRLVTLVLPCPQINRLAGLGVFAAAYPSRDPAARQVVAELALTEYPTILVLVAKSDRLEERYRMEGFFDAETVGSDLLKYIASPGSAPPPLPPPKPYESFGHLACTPASAKRLGLGSTPGR